MDKDIISHKLMSFIWYSTGWKYGGTYGNDGVRGTGDGIGIPTSCN